MSSETKIATQPVVVEIADDKMQATIRRHAEDQQRSLTPDEVTAALRQAGVVLTEEVQARVDEFVQVRAEGDEAPESFVVAVGTPPVEGKDEEFVWDGSFSSHALDWQGDAPVNYYALNSIATVDVGTVIGMITPAVPSRCGVDVLGRELKPQRSAGTYSLDATLARAADDPRQIIAKVAGRVVEKDLTLRIDEVLAIPGSIDFQTGNISATVHVHIGGTVPDRFEVRSSQSVCVGGSVEAAVIEAGDEIAVKRGIVGRHEGRVTAAGSIVARFCNEANLIADGDVKVGAQIMNSLVHTKALIVAERAAVIGGVLYAGRGGSVAALGSEGCVPTRVFIGPDPEGVREAFAIDQRLSKKRETVEKIEHAVKPLLANLKRLAPAQREQATELMFKAQEAAAEIAEEEARRDQLLQKDADAHPAQLRVADTIYPKVTISLGIRTTTFNEEMKGPILIEERKIKNHTEFVAVSQLTGSITELTSRRIPVADLMADYEPLATLKRVEAPESGDESPS